MDQTQAEKLLKLLTDNIAQGKDFVLEQAPDVVQQLILYKRIEYTFYAILCTLIIVVVSYVSIKCFRTLKYEDKIPVCILLSGIPICLLAPIFLGFIPELLKVWIAPKVFPLEYLAGLVK
jgi:hypothetical protein